MQHPNHTTRLGQCGGRVGRVTEFVIGDRLRSDPVGTWVDPLGDFVYGLIAHGASSGSPRWENRVCG